MNILGLSCFYHDSAAALVRDGQLCAAVQEERFDRQKNSSAFPINAINHCVQASGLSFLDLDTVGFYEKPYLKFLRVVMSHLRSWPWSYRTFMQSMPHWLSDRLVLPMLLKKELGFEGDVLFVKHHLSHAASAFLPSPFEHAAILTADGVGEWATTCWGSGRGSEITVRQELSYPHSLGLLYTALTTYLGYRAHEGEGTVMGLAATGEPSMWAQFDEILHVADDGSFALDPRYLDINRGARMFSRRLVKLLGPPRKYEDPLDQRHRDVAATLQAVVEDALLAMARHVHRQTGEADLCLAGGTFLNCVANQRILEETPFERVFIQPASGDAGGSVGVSLFLACTLPGGEREYAMEHPYLGPGYSDDEIRRAILAAGLTPDRFDEPELLRRTVELVGQGQVVGWFQGKLELGPRALGHRTILGDPRHAATKDRINHKVKHREPFRPFAPLVTDEEAADFFELSHPSPFMLLAPRVRPEVREVIPAVTHTDGTARVQTVSAETTPRLHALLGEAKAQLGVPVLINTSFNRNGEPIVCSPTDAITCYQETGMDSLVLGDYLLQK